MVAIEAIVPSAAMAGRTAANGSGAIRESTSSVGVWTGGLDNALRALFWRCAAG